MNRMFGRRPCDWPKRARALEASATVPAAAVRSQLRRVMPGRDCGAMRGSIAAKKRKPRGLREALEVETRRRTGLRAAGFARRGRPARRTLGGLARFLLRVARLCLVGFPPAETRRRRAQAAADALGLRLRFLRRRVAFGLRTRIELAADELDLRDFGAVALAVADPQQTRVPAGPRGEAGRERVEQLAYDLAVLQIVHDEPPGGEHAAIPCLLGALRLGFLGRQAALRDRDQPLHERPQLLRARHRRRQMLVAKQ